MHLYTFEFCSFHSALCPSSSVLVEGCKALFLGTEIFLVLGTGWVGGAD